MSEFLYRLGRTCARHPFRVLGLWLVAAIAVMALQSSAGGERLQEVSARINCGHTASGSSPENSAHAAPQYCAGMTERGSVRE